MHKKRVLFLGAFQEPGGEEEVITYLYRNLNSEQFEAYLCGPFRPQFFEKHQIGRDQILELEMKSITDFKSMRKLANYIDTYQIDIVHSHGSRGGLFGRIACLFSKRKVKSIWTLHLLIEENNYTISKLRKKVYTKIEYILSKYFTDYIICVSNDLMNKYKVNFKSENIMTIHNGIDIEKYFLSKQDNEGHKETYTFGFISRLSKQKGLPYLIRAWNEIVLKYKDDTNKNVHLVIAGTGEEEGLLKELISSHQLDKYVTLLGFRNDIPNILSQIDVLVLPSLFEGFPMVVLESLCSKTPVIASRVNGIPEVVKHNLNGRLVEPRNIDQLVESMSYYINDPKMILNHGLQGQQLIKEKFTKEKMLLEHKALYTNLTSESEHAI
ncbi:glycosyltransferase family 4 protein [Paenibacillus sp. Soil787]|uniref:glycosyltransferase family 4 protein n=1 Tax=Paenibacillus sp. Soil787 TaxID=1736411 RepID=UPI0006F863B0|nr:glycosyltransferase family 4 protein [Paenibacillus sp. Soil787]KRF35876.1 hypothetical protein ASG93_25675 [Paenibacillus sp. Soil787]